MDENIRCRLYLITPPDITDEALPAFEAALTEALEAGDVACVQLRLKDVADDVIREVAARLQPIVQDRDVAFILNDRPDLAAELGCDGVHVGQDDAAYRDARNVVGDDVMVGVTCHDSYHLAIQAGEAGADYVAFGAFFESSTKERRFAPEPDLLSSWQTATVVPSVAIGGITVENCYPVVEAGADFIAVSAGVWAFVKGPGEAVRSFNRIFDEVVGV
jgi:thiamine-phosphate pyrophosphorylase